MEERNLADGCDAENELTTVDSICGAEDFDDYVAGIQFCENEAGSRIPCPNCDKFKCIEEVSPFITICLDDDTF